MFRRRKQQEEDPFAALRGDGGPTLPGIPGTSATPSAAPTASVGTPTERAPGVLPPGRIITRRETGVLIAGSPRLELTIEVRPDGGAPVVVTCRTVAPSGSASDVGDEVVVQADRRGNVVDVSFRPEIRRPGGFR